MRQRSDRLVLLIHPKPFLPAYDGLQAPGQTRLAKRAGPHLAAGEAAVDDEDLRDGLLGAESEVLVTADARALP